MKKVLVFFNQLLDSSLSSGGDVRCAETIKRWKKTNLAVTLIGPKQTAFLKDDLKAGE